MRLFVPRYASPTSVRRPAGLSRVAGLALACAALAPAGHVGAADEEPLLTWDRQHPLLPDDGVPLVRVFADGRVVVTRPSGYASPGTREYDVGPETVARLEALARAATRGKTGDAIPHAPAGELRSRVTTLPDGTRVVSGVSDPTLSVFEYRPGGVAAKALGATSAPGDGGGTVAVRVGAPGGLAPTVDALQAGLRTLFEEAAEARR